MATAIKAPMPPTGHSAASAPKSLQNNLHKVDLVPLQRNPAGSHRRVCPRATEWVAAQQRDTGPAKAGCENPSNSGESPAAAIQKHLNA
jgi:hypothetical protein